MFSIYLRLAESIFYVTFCDALTHAPSSCVRAYTAKRASGRRRRGKNCVRQAEHAS